MNTDTVFQSHLTNPFFPVGEAHIPFTRHGMQHNNVNMLIDLAENENMEYYTIRTTETPNNYILNGYKSK